MPNTAGPGRGSPFQDEGQGWKGPDVDTDRDAVDPRLDPAAGSEDPNKNSEPAPKEADRSDVNR
ncbi:MAG: hypothetical protein JO053_05530 [Acidobacteria bacterium]|nr:hypothetical protein [Acidobacteriota bacterium]